MVTEVIFKLNWALFILHKPKSADALDAELDAFMMGTKAGLDKQMDDYMSGTKVKISETSSFWYQKVIEFIS